MTRVRERTSEAVHTPLRRMPHRCAHPGESDPTGARQSALRGGGLPGGGYTYTWVKNGTFCWDIKAHQSRSSLVSEVEEAEGTWS